MRIESTKVDYTGYTVLYRRQRQLQVDHAGDRRCDLDVCAAGVACAVCRDAAGESASGLRARSRGRTTTTSCRYRSVFQEDGDIERGNSSLKPTVSDNIDVLAEHYFESVGMISGGFFYKRLNDYIYPFRFQQTNFGELYNVTQPQNGEQATLWRRDHVAESLSQIAGAV